MKYILSSELLPILLDFNVPAFGLIEEECMFVSLNHLKLNLSSNIFERIALLATTFDSEQCSQVQIHTTTNH